MTIRIGLTGDVMLGRLVDERQRQRPVDAVWGDMLARLQDLDAVCINLECCLSKRGTPWRRTNRPFHFRASPDWAIPALERAEVDACALANNHILDFEEVALEDTLDVLDDAGIARTGAGRTLDEALEPAVLTVEGVTVAMVSFTDNTPEFAASEDTPGAAYIDIDVESERTRERVDEAITRAQRHGPDLLIASLHWGPNMVERPPESFQRFGRWLVEKGVDVIHGHSAHIFQGIEVRDGNLILYDTGDFVDDYAVDAKLRNDRSLLFELVVDRGGQPQELRLFPTEIYECTVNPAGPEAAEWSRNRLRRLSEEFGTTFERDGEELVLSLDDR